MVCFDCRLNSLREDLMRLFHRAFSPQHASHLLATRTLAGIFLGFVALGATAKDIGDPKLKSSSVLIVDERDSSVLFARHPDVAAPIASITKLMTALVILDARQALDEPIEITDADRDFPKAAFSRLTV